MSQALVVRGIAVGERHAVAGELVDVRGFVNFVPVTAEIMPPEIIGQDKQDVGKLRFVCFSGGDAEGRKDEYGWQGTRCLTKWLMAAFPLGLSALETDPR